MSDNFDFDLQRALSAELDAIQPDSALSRPENARYQQSSSSNHGMWRGFLHRRMVRPRIVSAVLVAFTATAVAVGLVAVSVHTNHSPVAAGPPPNNTHVITTGSASLSPGATHSPVPGSPTAPVASSPPPAASLPPQASPDINCVAKPSVCGFPDATNTGVPAGTTLAPVPQTVPAGTTWDATHEVLYVDQAGALIQDISVGPNASIWVRANNVTLRDVSVSGSGYYAVNIVSGVTGTTIEDSTLHGGDGGSNSVSYAIQDSGSGTQVLRVNLYYCASCAHDVAVIKDSYIHDLASSNSADDVTGGQENSLVVDHNTLLNEEPQEAVVVCPTSNCQINDNLLAGGLYGIFGGNGYGPGGVSGSNIAITNNRFSPIYFPQCGSTGYVTHFSTTVSGNAWSGNVWDNSNIAVTA